MSHNPPTENNEEERRYDDEKSRLIPAVAFSTTTTTTQKKNYGGTYQSYLDPYQRPIHFQQVPQLIEHILSFINGSELVTTMQLVCRSWRNLLVDKDTFTNYRHYVDKKATTKLYALQTEQVERTEKETPFVVTQAMFAFFVLLTPLLVLIPWFVNAFGIAIVSGVCFYWTTQCYFFLLYRWLNRDQHKRAPWVYACYAWMLGIGFVVVLFGLWSILPFVSITHDLHDPKLVHTAECSLYRTPISSTHYPRFLVFRDPMHWQLEGGRQYQHRSSSFPLVQTLFGGRVKFYYWCVRYDGTQQRELCGDPPLHEGKKKGEEAGKEESRDDHPLVCLTFDPLRHSSASSSSSSNDHRHAKKEDEKRMHHDDDDVTNVAVSMNRTKYFTVYIHGFYFQEPQAGMLNEWLLTNAYNKNHAPLLLSTEETQHRKVPPTDHVIESALVLYGLLIVLCLVPFVAPTCWGIWKDYETSASMNRVRSGYKRSTSETF